MGRARGGAARWPWARPGWWPRTEAWVWLVTVVSVHTSVITSSHSSYVVVSCTTSVWLEHLCSWRHSCSSTVWHTSSGTWRTTVVHSGTLTVAHLSSVTTS